MLGRRLTTVAVAAVALVATSAGPAAAHFCYHNNPNPNATQGRAGSNGFVSFHDLAFEFTGLCDEGIAVAADAAGITPDTMINAHGTMAGPTDGNKAIGHLDFAALDAALGTAEEPGPAFLACP